MPDKKITVLDVLARIESLEQKNASLQEEINELKSQQDSENWQELIIYKENGSETPVEISWADIETKEKRDHYSNSGFHTRTVIGKVRKVK